jgi:tRNA A37 methylthiotransferase MiaB
LDILYIHPAKQEADARYDRFISSPPYPFIPVGVVGLVNLLRADGWAVSGLNLPIELTLQPTFDLRGWLRNQASAASMVMIDLHWYEHCYGALDVAAAVKQVWAHTPVVIGGLTTSLFAEEILENFPQVDFAIRGDAEEPLRMLTARVCGEQPVELGAIPNLLYREKGRIRSNARSYFASPADLDCQDFVSTDWLEHAASYAAVQYSGQGIIALHEPKFRGHWLTIGRGCVFNCIYCGGGKHSHQQLAGRNGYVMRSPASVINDIARLKELGYDQASLSLDPATFGPEWWQSFFELLRRRSLTIGLYNEFFQLPSKEFIDEFAHSADLRHTEVAISPLSGDEAVRKQNGKFYTNERFLRMLETMGQHEIPIFVYFSLNLPGETLKTFKSTLQLAHEVGKHYPRHLLRMLNPCHTLDPLSPMSRQPEAFGMNVHFRTFMDYYHYCKATAWQARQTLRGEHRGFEMIDRPTSVVEQMARIWDMFAQQQPFRCAPVPRGW